LEFVEGDLNLLNIYNQYLHFQGPTRTFKESGSGMGKY